MNNSDKNINKTHKDGFIMTIALVIIAIALLKLVFNINVLSVLSNPKVHEVLLYAKNALTYLWTHYIAQIIDFIKQKIS